MHNELNDLYKKDIEEKISPPYAPESTRLAERLVQEHWTRTRVLLYADEFQFDI